MVRDLGRDTDIGIPPEETQKVNVVLSEPITKALKEQVAAKLDEANARFAKSNFIGELVLGEEVESDEGM